MPRETMAALVNTFTNASSSRRAVARAIEEARSRKLSKAVRAATTGRSASTSGRPVRSGARRRNAAMSTTSRIVLMAKAVARYFWRSSTLRLESRGVDDDRGAQEPSRRMAHREPEGVLEHRLAERLILEKKRLNLGESHKPLYSIILFVMDKRNDVREVIEREHAH